MAARRRLCQTSIHSTSAAAGSVLVDLGWVSSSSRFMVDQNDSMIVLFTEDATRPIEPSSPAARSRWPTTHDVMGSGVGVPDSTGLESWQGAALPGGHGSASTTSSARKWSAIDHPAICWENTSLTAAQ